MDQRNGTAMSRIASAIARLGRALARESGNAVVELAVGVSFLLAPVLLGAGELGYVIYDSIEVASAARTGATYGSVSSTNASNTTMIQSLAAAEAGDISSSNLTVTPSYYFVCSQAISGTQYSSSTAANSVCPSGSANHYIQFLRVSVSAAVTPPVRIPLLPNTWTLNSSSVAEVMN